MIDSAFHGDKTMYHFVHSVEYSRSHILALMFNPRITRLLVLELSTLRDFLPWLQTKIINLTTIFSTKSVKITTRPEKIVPPLGGEQGLALYRTVAGFCMKNAFLAHGPKIFIFDRYSLLFEHS